MPPLTIPSAAQLADLNLWKTSEQRLSLRITKDSGFGLFVEGPAVGTLVELRHRGVEINVQCTFPIVAGLSPFLPGQLGLFNSLFGIALAYEAKSIVDSQGAEVREKLFEKLWQYLQQNRGNIGDGNKRSIVCREPDQPIPQ